MEYKTHSQIHCIKLTKECSTSAKCKKKE
uniref:Uncharacterized protein n=1 Tax=Rhizophora mucronata TaxID=61149 RepID=A0A2P2PYH4_RHIMU